MRHQFTMSTCRLHHLFDPIRNEHKKNLIRISVICSDIIVSVSSMDSENGAEKHKRVTSLDLSQAYQFIGSLSTYGK